MSRIQTCVLLLHWCPPFAEVGGALIFRKSAREGLHTCFSPFSWSEQVNFVTTLIVQIWWVLCMNGVSLVETWSPPVVIILQARWCDCTVAMLDCSRDDARACGGTVYLVVGF